MTDWIITRTDSFLKDLHKIRKINQLLLELDKKIQLLKANPFACGKNLHGELSGSRSTRLFKRYRLIFHVDPSKRIVYLEAIDHRKDVYLSKF